MPILFALILWLVAELAVAIVVAHAIGVLLTVILLIAGWPIGSWLLRAEGRVALGRFRAAVAAGRPPAGEVVDGALVLIAGPLLIIPGFITDVLGLVLLVTPVRRRLGTLLTRHARSRFVTRVAGVGRRPPVAYDVDSTAHDAAPPERVGDRPQLHG